MKAPEANLASNSLQGLGFRVYLGRLNLCTSACTGPLRWGFGVLSGLFGMGGGYS